VAFGKDDLELCETCPARVPFEDITMHGEVGLCPACSAKATAAFDACDHDWHPDSDECGELVHVCNKCGGMVADDWFEHVIGEPAPKYPLAN